MPGSHASSSKNTSLEERSLNIPKKKVLSQIGELLFRQGMIDIKEKKRFDELTKKY